MYPACEFDVFGSAARLGFRVPEDEDPAAATQKSEISWIRAILCTNLSVAQGSM